MGGVGGWQVCSAGFLGVRKTTVKSVGGATIAGGRGGGRGDHSWLYGGSVGRVTQCHHSVTQVRPLRADMTSLVLVTRTGYFLLRGSQQAQKQPLIAM